MKISILFSVLVVGVAVECSEVADEQITGIDLRPAVDQIVQVIDFEAIQDAMKDVNVIACINNHDPNIIPYIYGEDFERIHYFLWTHPKFLEIIYFVAHGGYSEIYQVFNDLYDFLGLPFRVDEKGPIPNLDPIVVQPLHPAELCENSQEILETVRLAFPEEEFFEVGFTLMKTNPSVKAFIALMRQRETKTFFQELIALPEMQKLIEYGKSKNVPVNEIMYFVK